MFYVAGALAIAAGVFYSAELHEYGPTLCDKPLYLVAAGLATA
jgi:hypothetical protein